MFNPTGVGLALLFTLIFIGTNLEMIDFMEQQSFIRGQDGVVVLILLAILAYLYSNSAIERPFTKIKTIFLRLWSLYVISMGVSMGAADHLVCSEVLILVLITMM